MKDEIIKIAIIGTGKNAELLFYGISISDYNFDVCAVYDENNYEHRFNGIEVQSLGDLIQIENMSIDYVFNCISDSAEFLTLLSKVVKDDKKIKETSFINEFLTKTQKMMFLEKTIYMEFQCKYVSQHISVGEFTYGVPNVETYKEKDATKLQIGKFCSIANDVTIICGGLHRADWISTYPFNMFLQDYNYIDGHPTTKGDIIIGNDVWIGRGATILSGVTIGDGAVIAANATVTKNVEPYTIVGGVPAKFIKKRFSDDIIDKILDLKWWDWDYEKIYDAIPLLQSGKIDALLEISDK